MFRRPSSLRSGFTLVELLVIVLVVSIVSVVIVSNVRNSKAVARDAQRLTDLQNLQVALRLYKDAHGRYPSAGCGRGNAWTGNHPSYGACPDYITGLSEFNGGPLPVDPIPDARFGYIYRTDNQGSEYKVLAYGSVEATYVDNQHQFSRFRDCSTATNATTFAVWEGSVNAPCW